MAIVSIFHFIFVLYFANSLQKCKSEYRVKRIIGGEHEDSSDQDFMAALIGEKGYSWDVLKMFGENRKTYCSGSLITDQWIITAAHCFTAFKDIEEDTNYENENISQSDEDIDFDEDDDKIKEIVCDKDKAKKRKIVSVKEIIDFSVPSYWKVRVGVKNLKPTVKEQIFYLINKFFNKSTEKIYHEVSKIIRHPKYDPLYLENDVALLKLKEKLKISINGSINTVPITKYNVSGILWPPAGLICKVMGWGCKEYEGSIMNQPHFVNLPILKSDYCRKIYRTDINLTDSQEFCAGYYDQDKGICAGDSGGPLICLENGIATLSGIVSATHITNPSKYPGIFSRISYFKDWINSVIYSD